MEPMAESSKVKEEIEADQKEPGIKRCGWLVIILGAAGLLICLYLYSFHIELSINQFGINWYFN